MANDTLTEMDDMKRRISMKGGLTSRAEHLQYCRELISGMSPRSSGPHLAKSFYQSLKVNQQKRCFIDHPFLGHEKRKLLAPNAVGAYRTAWLLFGDKQRRKRIRVAGGPPGYEFECVSREVPPLREPGVGKRSSGRGGIDYLAVATGSNQDVAHSFCVPVLGEIKSRSEQSKSSLDKDAFYAFIQSLWYLSRMATQNQVDRAAKYSKPAEGGFGISLAHPQKFDVHLLLADVHLLPKSTRNSHREVSEATCELAQVFVRKLPKHARSVVGRVLCLQLDSDVFEKSAEPTVYCSWWA